MMIELLIGIILLNIIWIVFLVLVLNEVKKFLRETLYLLKSRDVFEAKQVLKEEKEEPEIFEKEIPLEDFDPDKAIELLKKELENQ
jgi:hypothetical protein